MAEDVATLRNEISQYEMQVIIRWQLLYICEILRQAL
jgi:hypothetical protein